MASSDSHAHGRSRASSERALVTALLLTTGFALVEVIAGRLSGSLALLGDAGHMVTDSMALALGAVAARLSRRPPTRRHTFGLQRAEVVGALLNAGFMLVVVAWIGYEAVQRLIEPVPVKGGMVLVVAAVGLAVNGLVLRILHGGEQTLNTRGAILHVLGDLLGSVAALASGLVIWLTGWLPVDPILSLVISVLILVSTTRLLRESFHVVMEGVPPHVELPEVGQALAGVEGVRNVHDLHVWTIASGSYALAAHVTLDSLERWPQQQKLMERLLREEFGIGHVTLQPELRGEVVVLAPPGGRGQGDDKE